MGRRSTRPPERLRSGWKSVADLEETLAAMFQVPVAQDPPLRPEVIDNNNQSSTLSAEPSATVYPDQTDTVTDAPQDTVSIDKAAKVSVDKTATVLHDPTAMASDQQTATVADELADTVVDGKTATVSTIPPDTVAAGLTITDVWYTEGKEGLYPSSRVRPITLAQDALTHSEEAVYDVLWGPKNQNRDTERFTSMGYNSVANAARVTKMNAKFIIERLIFKGFMRIETLPDPLRRIPTRYCIFSYRAALDNMLRSNRHYVVRTGNGVLFAHRFRPSATVATDPRVTVADGSTGRVASGQQEMVSDDQLDTGSPGQTDAVAAGQSNTVSDADTLLGTPSETSVPSSSSAVVAKALLPVSGFIDDDALVTLVHKCQQNAPDATDEEIAELAVMTAHRIRHMRNINNPVGLLIKGTANCFLGEPLKMYRKEKRDQEERLKHLYDQG
jgi:hypothetical protein